MNIFLCHKCHKISVDKSIITHNNIESNNLSDKEQDYANCCLNTYFYSPNVYKLNKPPRKKPSQESELQTIDYPYNNKKESQNDFSKSTLKMYNFENDNVLTVGHYVKPSKKNYYLLNLNNNKSVKNKKNAFYSINNYDNLFIKKNHRIIPRKRYTVIKINKTNNNSCKNKNKTNLNIYQNTDEYGYENNNKFNYKKYSSNNIFKPKEKHNNKYKYSGICLNNNKLENKNNEKLINENKIKKSKTSNSLINKKNNNIPRYSVFSSIIKSINKIVISNNKSGNNIQTKNKNENNNIKNRKKY